MTNPKNQVLRKVNNFFFEDEEVHISDVLYFYGTLGTALFVSVIFLFGLIL